MIKEIRKQMLLQLFGETGGETGGESGETGGETGGESNDEPMGFDDFLKLEGNQSEFDRRVQKAIDTALTKAKAKWQAMTDDKMTEAEKLAKMNKEEKALYKAKRAEQKLADLEAKIAKGELEKEARKTLADTGLNVPDVLISGLIRDNAEATKEAVEAFANLFKEAVGEAVKKKARQNPPGDNGGGGTGRKKSMAELAKEARII